MKTFETGVVQGLDNLGHHPRGTDSGDFSALLIHLFECLPTQLTSNTLNFSIQSPYWQFPTTTSGFRLFCF